MHSVRPLQEHTTEKHASCLTRKCLCFILALIRRFALVWLSVSVLSSNSGAGGWVVSCGFCTMTICLPTTGHLQRTPLSSSPKYWFWSQLTKNLLSLKHNRLASVVALRLHIFCITGTFLGHVFSPWNTTEQNWSLFSGPPHLFLHPNRD